MHTLQLVGMPLSLIHFIDSIPFSFPCDLFVYETDSFVLKNFPQSGFCQQHPQM